ncbi:MAG: ATP-binding protein [bacterium]
MNNGLFFAFTSKKQYFFSAMGSIRFKIVFSYFFLICISLVTSGVAIYNFSELDFSVKQIMQGYKSFLGAQDMVRALNLQESIQDGMLSSHISFSGENLKDAVMERPLKDDFNAALGIFNRNRDVFMTGLQRVDDTTSIYLKHPLIPKIIADYKIYLEASDSFYLLLPTSQRQPYARRYFNENVRPRLALLKDHCESLLQSYQISLEEADRFVREASNNAIFAILLTSLTAIFLSIISSIRFVHDIVEPAEKLTATVRKISRGHLNQKIDITTNDELSELGKEFNKMTERLRQYEAMNVHQLIAEKKKSEAITTSIPDPVFVTDQHNCLVQMNQSAQQIFEIVNQDWQGKPLQDVLKQHQWSYLLHPEEMEKLERSSKDSVVTVQKNMQTLFFRPRQTTIIDERGEIQGVVTLLQDVTRFKNLDNMKSEFIATVSHEFRTPLTSINMAIDILSQEVLGTITPSQRDLIAAAKDDCERLTKLVKELLNLSRLESGKYEFKREQVNIHHLVDEAIKPLRLQFLEKGIKLDLSIDPAVLEVPGDEQQLIWVISNLVSNALRYTPEAGIVRLAITSEQRQVKFSVTDTGRGIPVEAIESIFDKFIQVRQSDDATPGSVGLGLAIAKEVVEVHGGTIWVESQVNKGSAFHFTLPKAEQSP